MIEASEPSTEDVAGMRYVACARPTGGSHGRTARGSAQRRGGAKRKAALSNRGEAEQRGQQHTHYKAGARKPRPTTVESQEPLQMPWWRRVFRR
jgi:hypothetical protein